jgi:pimeloyl-ACP methyl ester carboxylesterase
VADETLVPRPSPLLGLTEPMRAAADFASLLPGRFWLNGAPRGDGHRVVVLPGFTANDRSTVALRGFLQRQGFAARGWELGRNLGSPELSSALDELLARALDETGAAVSLVGWSLGGVLARNLARREPGKVRNLITLGSPIAGSPTRTRAWRLYQQVHRGQDSEHSSRFDAGGVRPPPEGVSSTAIWSRSDGIVPWQIAREQPGPRRENLEVFSSHLGLGVNAAVLYAVADRLSQPPEAWQPFESPWWLRPVLRPAS